MIFSDLYRSPKSPFSKLRGSLAQPVPHLNDLDADLISKDKVRQKEAVKKYLAEKIRNDWDFVWPPTVQETLSGSPPVSSSGIATVTPDGASSPASSRLNQTLNGSSHVTANEDTAPRDPGEEADSESDAESVYSTISEDPAHFRPRAEWTSDISDDDEPHTAPSPFRFDSPDAVGTAVACSLIERQTRRRRAVREEATWNPGLACFEARRNTWTGAKTVRIKPKPPTPVTPSSPRRLFWRHHRSDSSNSNHAGFGSSSPLSPSTTHTSQHTDASAASPPASELESTNSLHKNTAGIGAQRTPSQTSTHAPYPVETVIPIPPPLLPPQNPMRASVTPSIYPSLYDKIVVHNLQPSCPVNLSDMIRSCVVGWKRDGEWPPRPQMVPPVLTATDLAAMRHRKTLSAHQQHVHKGSTATNGSSRRLSFGFLGGARRMSEEKEADKDKESKENGSDEGAGKAIRRSLQKVFSLGQHGFATSPSHTATNAPLSPTSPTNANPTPVVVKEGAAAA